MAKQFDPYQRQATDPVGYRWSEFESRYVATLTPEGGLAPPLEDPRPPTMSRLDATSDVRTVNNTFRHQYRVLSPHEKQSMLAIKDKGLEFVKLLHEIGGSSHHFEVDGENARLASRHLSLAATAMEEAVMWAVKHLTK